MPALVLLQEEDLRWLQFIFQILLRTCDLIAFIPWRYDDWSHVGTIGSFDMNDRFADNTGFDLSFRGTISTNPSVNVTSRKRPLSFFVSDGTGRIKLTFFNSQYLAGKFSLGDECFVHGSVTLFCAWFRYSF